uniref:Uncharacterized protein n=1 Tax=Anopheles farauti TaxID=69004 RepID=A0A182QB56_9DIPT
MATQFLADPLYLLGYGYTMTTASSTKEEDENIRVTVASPYVSSMSMANKFMRHPHLSSNGQEWYDLIRTSTGNRAASIRALMPTPFAIDQGSLCYLIAVNINNIHQLVCDEAVLLRCLLMWMTFIPGDMMADRSTCLTSLRYGSSSCTYKSTSIHRADRRGNIDGCPWQIPIKKGTSKLIGMPLDVYTGYRTGHAMDKYTRWSKADIQQAVIVPVRAADLSQSWIMAYIISHTTTRWWNHSVTHQYSVEDDRSISDETFTVYAMSRACMVDVPDEDPAPSLSDFRCAIDHMRTECGFEETFARALSMAAELSFGLPLGYSVDTDGNAPSTTKRKVNGPRNMNIDRSSSNNKFADEQMGDLAVSWADIGDWLMGKGDWRIWVVDV